VVEKRNPGLHINFAVAVQIDADPYGSFLSFAFYLGFPSHGAPADFFFWIRQCLGWLESLWFQKIRVALFEATRIQKQLIAFATCRPPDNSCFNSHSGVLCNEIKNFLTLRMVAMKKWR